MKKIILLIVVSVAVSACGTATKQVSPIDSSAMKAVEVAQKSNSERVAKLEKDMDNMRQELDSMRIQTRQLADSYDSLVKLFREHKKLTLDLMTTVNRVLLPQSGQDKK
jgi:TolA-binding protein